MQEAPTLPLGGIPQPSPYDSSNQTEAGNANITAVHVSSRTAEFLDQYTTREQLLHSTYHESPGRCKYAEKRLSTALQVAARSLRHEPGSASLQGADIVVPAYPDDPIASFVRLAEVEDSTDFKSWTDQPKLTDVPVFLKNPTAVHDFQSIWFDLRGYAGQGPEAKNNGWGARNGLTAIDGVVFIVQLHPGKKPQLGRPVVAEDQKPFMAMLQGMYADVSAAGILERAMP